MLFADARLNLSFAPRDVCVREQKMEEDFQQVGQRLLGAKNASASVHLLILIRFATHAVRHRLPQYR